MNIGVDSYFTNARRPEKNCQDYAIHNQDKNGSYIIVSDGCSSSRNTDFGSRILSHLCADFFNNNPDIDSYTMNQLKQELVRRSKMFPMFLSLPNECMDATLIASYLDNDYKGFFVSFGDGYIIHLFKNGDIEYWKIEYEHNAPYYLSYLMTKGRHDSYIQFSGYRLIKRMTHSFKEGCVVWDSDPRDETYIDYKDDYTLQVNDLSMSIICTDGISSFVNLRTGEKIQDTEIIKQITSVKGKEGEFIKRRIKRMIKDLSENDIFNYDDIGVAAFVYKE